MGSVADIVGFGDWTRMRQWMLAMAVAIAGANALAAAGLIETQASFYTSPRFTLGSYVLGGLVFGFGMVLAGGCGSRALVRVGGGSLKALVAAAMLAIFAYITLRGMLAVVRVGAIEPLGVQLASPQDLPSLAGGTGAIKAWLQLAFAGVAAAVLSFVVFSDRQFATFDNVLAGAGIGAVIVGLWAVSGYLGHVIEHPETLEDVYLRTNSGKMEALSFVAPVAWTLDYLMFFSDTSKVLTVGVAAVLGVVTGSAIYAIASGNFRWEGFRDTEDTANHLVGGALMGFGGVTAFGCTIGQGVSGVSLLALGSMVATGSIIAGALLGLRYQTWRTARD